MRRRANNRPPNTMIIQTPVLPPVAPVPLEEDELLEDDELLEEELVELLLDEEELLDDELLEEELELELDEEDELLLVDLRTRMELRVALSVLVVSAISSFPSVTLASNVCFHAVLAPTSSKISTLESTRWPSIATSKERIPADVWYISTKPSSTDTR